MWHLQLKGLRRLPAVPEGVWPRQPVVQQRGVKNVGRNRNKIICRPAYEWFGWKEKKYVDRGVEHLLWIISVFIIIHIVSMNILVLSVGICVGSPTRSTQHRSGQHAVTFNRLPHTIAMSVYLPSCLLLWEIWLIASLNEKKPRPVQTFLSINFLTINSTASKLFFFHCAWAKWTQHLHTQLTAQR